MGTIQQSLGSLVIGFASSCTLDSLVQEQGEQNTLSAQRELSQGAVSSVGKHGGVHCSTSAMTCSLPESTVSNEEHSTATVICRVPRRSCFSSVSYDAGDLGTDSLTIWDSRHFYGSIPTEASASGTYSIVLTSSYRSASTTATVSLEILDTYAPSLSCTASDGANDGSQNIELLCSSSDETSLSSLSYISSLGTDTLTNTGTDTYEATLDVTALSGGVETIYVIAEDSSANITTSKLTSTVNDMTSPTLTSISPVGSYVFNYNAESFAVSACFNDETDGTALGGSVTATIDSLVETLSYDSGTNCFVSSSIPGTYFSEGTYTISVSGSDTAGNTVTDTTGSVNIIDNCSYPCSSPICLYVDGELEAEQTTSSPSQMTAIDTVRLGYSGQSFDNLLLVVDGVTSIDQDFSSSVGCFSSGAVTSGVYVSGSDSNCVFSPSFDATSSSWMVSIDVLAGSSPNFALLTSSSSYSSQVGINWDFAARGYIDDGAGNTVSFTSGTPDSSIDHTITMCNQND